MRRHPLFDYLLKHLMTCSIHVGYSDVVNGYGWHINYHVEIHKHNTVCTKCALNSNHTGNHRWIDEQSTIYFKKFEFLELQAVLDQVYIDIKQ